MAKLWRRFAVLAGLLIGSATGHARGEYVVVDIGVITPGGSSSGLGINASGLVAGSAVTPTSSQNAIVGNGLGVPNDLGTLSGGRFSEGRAINDQGVVAGDSEILISPGVYVTHAFRGTTNGLVDLGVLPGTRNSVGTGINDSEQVSGYSMSISGVRTAFLADPGGQLMSLGPLIGGGSSQANGINGSGTIVGTATNASGVSVAVRGTVGSGLSAVGNLPGGTGTSAGLGINNNGEVVGFAGTLSGDRAVRSLANGTLQSLGVLANATASRANAVNDSGVIVGNSTFSNGDSRAFIFTDSAKILDLNLLIAPGSGWVLSTATGINSLGQISGTGLFNGQMHAFRLDPAAIPEPASLALFACGGLGLLAYRAFAAARQTRTN